MKRFDTNIFIEKSKEIHGDFYDYSLVDYKNMKEHVKIICPDHGIFEQNPYKHLLGRGCRKCANNYPYTTESYIEKCITIHGNKYDYSLVEYKGNKNKIKIICPTHGVFEQTPLSHLKGYNCPICSGKYNFTTDIFIEKSKEIHGNKYDYSLVDYKNDRTKIKIICPTHGIFEQEPRHHIRGSGCPVCNLSKGELKIIQYLIDNNYKFDRQKRFEKCIYKRELPFDFYISLLNTCIEFDGLQHEEIGHFNMSDDEFEESKLKDQIKTKFCVDNNIRLIRIRYNENIEEKLNLVLV